MSDDCGPWTTDHYAIIDVLNQLRLQGVNGLVDARRIIVCGDQSCGKSSLIRAITGLDLPVKTRFAIELVFRRSEDVGVTTRILPASDRPQRQKQALSVFYRYQNYLDIRRPIEDATQSMYLVTKATNFCRDILHIEVTGPTQPDLTLVDLPGLLLAGNRDYSMQDAEDIEDVMLGHMRQEKNVILAVISAKSSFAHQLVTRHARKFDPHGTRTLGIITKPDTLDAGSESEQFYVELAQNTANSLGWHVICNQDYANIKLSATERDKAEADFFANGIWRDYSHCGAPALRIRLNKILYYRALEKLRRITGEVEVTIEDTEGRLFRLGSPRNTIDEQRRYVCRVDREFASLMKAAIDGLYTSLFFMNSEIDAYSRRLRTVVHNTLCDFAEKMRKEGQAQIIYDEKTSQADGPRWISRTRYMEKVETLFRQSHGHKLPGLYNPIVISELFREQCKP